MKFRSLIMTSLAVALGFSSVSVAAVPGDYNGMGLSDPAVVQRMSNGNTRWTIKHTETGFAVDYDFPGLGDAMVMQRIGGVSRPGIVRVLSLTQPLEWQIYQPNGSIRKFYFGMPGDIVPAHGADFDGNQISDCVVIRNVNGALRWFIAPDCNESQFYSFDWGVAATDRPLPMDFFTPGVGAAVVVRKSGPNLQWWARSKDGQVNNVTFGNSDDFPQIAQSFFADGNPTLAVARKTASGMQMWFRRMVNGNETYEMKALGDNTAIPFTGGDANIGAGIYGVYLRNLGFGALANVFGGNSFFTVGGSSYWFVSPDGQVYPQGQGPTAIGGGSGGGDTGGNGGDDEDVSCGGSKTISGTTYSSEDCTVKLSLPDGGGKNKSNSENSKGVIKMMIDGRYSDDMVTDGSGKATWLLCSDEGKKLDELREATPREYGNRRRCYGSKSLSSLSGQRNMTVVAPKRGGGAFCAKLPSNRTID